MLKRVLVISVVLILVIGVAGCVQPAMSIEEAEDSFLRQVNAERVAQGLSTLEASPQLKALAKEYAGSQFSDEVWQSSDFRDLLRNSWKQSYGGGRPRISQDTVKAQVAYCRGEPELREAMFRPEARATGVGVAVVGDAIFYTQVFDVLNVVGGDGQPIRLFENQEAVNPSWAQLKEFLETDDTDKYIYQLGSFVCGDFAETLHNNAEEAGIRAAYVSVSFNDGPGHALDAFSIGGQTVFVDVISGDKIAYLEVGEKYGVIALDVAADFSYSYFETYAQRVEQCLHDREAYSKECASYNAEVESFNLAVKEYESNRTLAEYNRLQEWGNALRRWSVELDSLNSQLNAEEGILGIAGKYFDPTGSLAGVTDPTVVKFYVHW